LNREFTFSESSTPSYEANNAGNEYYQDYQMGYDPYMAGMAYAYPPQFYPAYGAPMYPQMIPQPVAAAAPHEVDPAAAAAPAVPAQVPHHQYHPRQPRHPRGGGGGRYYSPNPRGGHPPPNSERS
jgi:hypothetical protein